MPNRNKNRRKGGNARRRLGKQTKPTETLPLIKLGPLQIYLEQHNIEPEPFKVFEKSLNLSKVLTPFSGDKYTEARKLSDPAFNNYPLFIVRCKNVADVVSSVNFARNNKIHVCARAGGHNTAGYSVQDNHMVIDVSRMKGVFVDPSAKIATVEAGVKWGPFNHALNAYGLHTPGGGCDDVGLTGFTLGGGYGYTSRRWGMACDNLLEVTLVTADGNIVTANANHNKDLLWAHQGGTGGNFGIVVALKYRLYQLKKVFPIKINWHIDEAAEVLTFWQDHMTITESDTRLGLLGFLIRPSLPPGKDNDLGELAFGLRGIYADSDVEAGKKALDPILKIGHPTIACELWQSQVDYSDANTHLLDDDEGVVPDNMNETKRCSYIEKRLTQDQYQQIVDYFKLSPNKYNLASLEPYGGVINQKRKEESAFVHRSAYFDFFVDSFWLKDDEKDAAFNWLHNFYESPKMKPLWSSHYYQNYPNSEYKDWQHGYFGTNYRRLQEIKAKWDPTNFFQFEQGIQLP